MDGSREPPLLPIKLWFRAMAESIGCCSTYTVSPEPEGLSMALIAACRVIPRTDRFSLWLPAAENVAGSSCVLPVATPVHEALPGGRVVPGGLISNENFVENPVSTPINL